MNKKNFILFTVVAAVIFLTSNLWADVTMSVGSASGRPGDTNITVPITVSDVAGLGVIGIDISLRYDVDNLTLTNVTAGVTPSWYEPVYNPAWKNRDGVVVPGAVKIALYGTTPLSSNGTLANLIFTIKGNATSGDKHITLINTDPALSLTNISFATQLNDGSVASTLQSGKITVSSGGVRGDITGPGGVPDGIVNATDVQACVNHILGVQDYGSLADVTGDGKVDATDVQTVVNIILGAG